LNLLSNLYFLDSYNRPKRPINTYIYCKEYEPGLVLDRSLKSYLGGVYVTGKIPFL
jgi:hypothetical protein